MAVTCFTGSSELQAVGAEFGDERCRERTRSNAERRRDAAVDEQTLRCGLLFNAKLKELGQLGGAVLEAVRRLEPPLRTNIAILLRLVNWLRGLSTGIGTAH